MVEELVAKVFCVRDCAHYAHWATTSGYHHGVLGEFYDEVVGFADRIMEAYIGNFDEVPTIKTIGQDLKDDRAVLKCLETDVAWIAKNRDSISAEIEAIEAIVDELVELYLDTIFKLKRLK